MRTSAFSDAGGGHLTPAPTPAGTAPVRPRVRLEYLDGLRGLTGGLKVFSVRRTSVGVVLSHHSLLHNPGAGAAGLVAFSVGFALLLAFPQALSQASPHFLGLFALGMIAADINFSPDRSWQGRPDWGRIAVAAFLVLCVPPSLYHRFFAIPVVGKDLLVGLGTACLLVHCTHCLQGVHGPRRPWILGLLQSRALVALGTFFYSLYLIHAPVIASVQPLLASFHRPPTLSLALMFLMTVPAALGTSYLFYLAFERPFAAGRAGTPS